MSSFDSKIWKSCGDALDEEALRKEAHELLDSMSDEQIAQIIPYLKTLL